MYRHDSVKIYNVYVKYICRHSSRRSFIWRYYIERGEKVINYARRMSFPLPWFSLKIIDEIRRLHRIHTLWPFIFLYSETTLKRKVSYK